MQKKDRKNTIYDRICNCILLVENEISLHMQNKEADGDIETLIAIKKELENMRDSMSPNKYMPSYNYIIRDSLWDYMKLANELLGVYHEYVRL